MPDRPWTETNPDGSDNAGAGWRRHPRPNDLAGRLARLMAGHPSADLDPDPDQHHLNTDDLDPDDVDPGDLDPDNRGRDELDSDDLEAADIDAGAEGKGSATDGFRPRRSLDSPPRGSFGAEELRAYRPWFSADGASDPWFAEPTDWG